MTDVFISYSRRNLAFVQQLDAALTAQGKTCWFDQKKEPLEGIPPGSKWWDEIKHGIETADNFLFIISPASIASPYCNAEIAHAIHHEKRIVTVLYHGPAGEADTLRAVDTAIDAIPDHSELPPSVSAAITNLRSLTRRNWLEISKVQYVTFSDNGTFDQSLRQLIQGLDMDLAWLRTWSQVRQTARVWKETGDDSYLWSEMRLKPIREMIEKRRQPLTDVERDFIRSEAERLLHELENLDTSHARREEIGRRLEIIGDTRPGVGLRPDGLPDIEWCAVPGGRVEIMGQTFNVQPFYIAKYLITNVQFQAFIDAPNGYRNDSWWKGLAEEYRKQKLAEPTTKFSSYPRNNISWYQTVAFCRWLNAKLPPEAWPEQALTEMGAASRASTKGENRTGLFNRFFRPGMRANWQIRLPTEWEWFQAATGGDPANQYPWGAEWDGRRANTGDAGLGRAITVGMYPPGVSPAGVLDMSGNLWEWCLNEYENLKNIRLGGGEPRVQRGGAYDTDSASSGCSARDTLPFYLDDLWGGRVVCGPVPIPR